MAEFFNSVIASLIAAAIFEILLLLLSRAHKPTTEEPAKRRGLLIMESVWLMTMNGFRVLVYIFIIGIGVVLTLIIVGINKYDGSIILTLYIVFALLTAIFPNSSFSKWFYGIYNEHFLGKQ